MLPSSGPMSMTLIGNESGQPLNNLNIDQLYLRKIARKKTLASSIKWSDFYGKYRYQFVGGKEVAENQLLEELNDMRASRSRRMGTDSNQSNSTTSLIFSYNYFIGVLTWNSKHKQ